MAAHVVGARLRLSALTCYPALVRAFVGAVACEVSARAAARVVGSQERFGVHLLGAGAGAFSDIGVAACADERSAAKPPEQAVVAACADAPLLAPAPALVGV